MKFQYLIIAIVSFQCTPPVLPQIIGHRGAKGHIAENTLPSVAQAMKLGVDGIEIDVFLCQTGELVVFHDKTLEKLTDAKGYIEALTLDSIKKINVLDSYKIPTLSEVIDLIDGKFFLNIELKGSGTAQPTQNLLKKYLKEGNWNADQFIISSFDWKELKLFYELNKEVPIAILTEADPLDAIPIAGKLKAKSINPDFNSLNEKNVKKIHQAGYKVYPYTVNKPKDIQQMLAFKVDGIITDFPDRVEDVLLSD
mgnify:FL=1